MANLNQKESVSEKDFQKDEILKLSRKEVKKLSKEVKNLGKSVEKNKTYSDFDDILNTYGVYLTENDKIIIEGLKATFDTDIEICKTDLSHLWKIMKSIETDITGVEGIDPVKFSEIQFNLQYLYFTKLSEYDTDYNFEDLAYSYTESGFKGSQEVLYFYIVDEMDFTPEEYETKKDQSLGAIKDYYDFVLTDPTFEETTSKIAERKGETVIESDVELSEEELENYNNIIGIVGLIADYKESGKVFMENLKKNNLTHLKEILTYRESTPHGVKVSRTNVEAYVAYCGEKNNGEPDLELWETIVTDDEYIFDDYPDRANIRDEYIKIK